MKVAFDAHIPRGFVDALTQMRRTSVGMFGSEFCSALDYSAREDGRNDAPWMQRFRLDGGEVVITGDTSIRGNLHEQIAFMEARLILYMPHARWNQMDLNAKLAFLMKWLPLVEGHARGARSPSCWELPAGWTNGDFTDKTPPYGNQDHGHEKHRTR